MKNIDKLEFHPKVWGSEHWIVNSAYCGKLLTIDHRYRCSIHYHKNKEETFFVIKGMVLMEIDGKKIFLDEGEKIDILPGTKHRFTGYDYLHNQIIEFSTHHEEEDSYRDVESGYVRDDEWEEIRKLYLTEKGLI